MSTVLEAPRPQIFDSVDFFDHRVVGANIKRWVFFAGDLIVPERKSEIDWLKVGGEEVPSPCLQRYGRNFVPRGLASILELGGEPMPMCHLGDLQSTAWAGIPLNESAAKNNFGFVPVWPGDGLKVMQRYSAHQGKKGIDEVTALRGKEWDECHTEDKDGILDVIELACYGDGMAKTLRELEDQIRFAKITDMRIDVGLYKKETLQMCDDFRNWAMRKVNQEHGLLKTGSVALSNDAVGATGGWSYFYSPVTEMLLFQLEIARQDQPIHEMSKMVSALAMQSQQVPQSQGLSAADLELINRNTEALLTKARETDAARIADLEAQLAAKDVVAVADTPTTYTCEHCNEEVKVAGKGIHAAVHCKVLHPKSTE
jgi:hypothetical protein